MTNSNQVPAPASVVIRDISISWPHYVGAVSTLSPLSPHLFLHLAGPTAEGVRIVELWDSLAESRKHLPNELSHLEGSVATPADSVRVLEVTQINRGLCASLEILRSDP